MITTRNGKTVWHNQFKCCAVMVQGAGHKHKLRPLSKKKGLTVQELSYLTV